MARFDRFTLLLSCAFATACASPEAPTKQLAESEAAVRAATELGATDTPKAALHLQMAKDRLGTAKAFDARGEFESAKRLFEEAKADAELAVALTREQQAEADARNAQDKLSSAPSQPGPSDPSDR
jgi:hypothetical protein